MKKFIIKLYYLLTGRCLKCGRRKISWGYYSGAEVCKFCDLKEMYNV